MTTNYKYYNYKYTGYNISASPSTNPHFYFEVSTTEFYFIDSTSKKLYYFNISNGTESQIDINTVSGTDRVQTIISIWHDQANSIIYFVDCDQNADDYDVWSLDYSVSVSSPTITDIGTSTGAQSNSVTVYDIFMIGSNVYVFSSEQIISPVYYIIRDVDTSPFTEIHKEVTGEIVFQEYYYGVVIGDYYYTLVAETNETGLHYFIFDLNTPNITYDEPSPLPIPCASVSGFKMASIASDGSNYLYFADLKTSSPREYSLWSWKISTTTFTELGATNVCMMLDRNTDSTNNPPFNLEKGFHISEDKIYQIPSNYLGRVNMISSFNFTDTIITITDHYVIDASGNVYELVDVIAENYFSYLFLDYWKEDYPTLDMEYRSDKFSVEKGQFIQIIGYLSADDQDRLFKGTYDFRDELGDTGTDISWVDAETGDDSTYSATVIASEDGHRNVIKFLAAGDNGKYAQWRHTEAETADTKEFWWKIVDKGVGEHKLYGINEGSSTIIYLRYNSADNKLDYWYGDGVGGSTTGEVAIASDTWFHIKIEFSCATDTFSLWVDGDLQFADKPFFNDRTATSIPYFRLQVSDGAGANSLEMYMDAYGEVNNDADYIEGDNQYIEEGGEEQVVFEGIVDEYTGRRTQMAKVLNQCSEMDEIEPTGEYTVDTDGLIDGIIEVFHNYITKGTRQDGADLGTITLKGNKKSRKYFNQIKDFDGYTWALRPQGALDYDDGSVSTDVALLYEKDDHEDDPIWDVDTIPISSGTNQVIVKGKINPATGVPYEDQWDDEEDQQQFGIHKIIIIDALLDSNAKCLTKATAIGTREGGGYLTVQFSFRKPLLGVIYPHQTLTFKYISEDIEVSQATYIVDGIGVDLLQEVCFLQSSTGLIFEYKSIEKELPEENAQKVEQNAETLTTKATVYVSASDPTVNEDVDSGYLDGDLWINSGDAGVFILIDNSSGAANWDELAKV